MPIYTRETLKTDRLPWVEIEDFEFLVLGRNMPSSMLGAAAGKTGTAFWGVGTTNPMATTRRFESIASKQRLVVLGGEIAAEHAHGRVTLKRRDWIDVPDGGLTLTNLGTTQAEVARFCGHWRGSIRTELCLFTPDYPCDYHYHDGDEYWFVFRGHFTLDYYSYRYAIKPGLLFAAPMGFEHGISHPEEQMQAVVFATTLEGGMRDGHLDRERHGIPQPGREVPASMLEPFCIGSMKSADVYREPAGELAE